MQNFNFLIDIINTVTLINFGVTHQTSDGFTFGQSFWFTVCSTIASVITNVTLIWDFLRTPDFAASGKSLCVYIVTQG